MLDQRTIPNYTIAEASRCLGIPAATLRSWFKGQVKDGKRYDPFLAMSDPSRLTFFEMMEADALFLMSNGNQTTLRTFRQQLAALDPRDLVRKNLFYDRHSIYRQFEETVVSLRERGQVYGKALIDPYLKRVRYDAKAVAYRIYPFLSRPSATEEGLPKLDNIVIDPKVCYGAVFHERIGAPVAIVGKRFDLGDDEDLLAKDYDTSKEYIREALSTMLSPTVLVTRVQQLLDERQQHEEAIEKIDKTLAGISTLLGTGPVAAAGRKSAAKLTIAIAPSPSPVKRRRKRGAFAVTGEQSILAFVKQKRNPTTKQINAQWKQDGRGGVADSLLGKLVKEQKLKRKALGGKRGSEYSLA